MEIRAILTDVDGTLYRQGYVRRRMAARLCGLLARSPSQGWETLRAVRAYRNAQEQMRREGFVGAVHDEQVRRATMQTGLSAVRVRLHVSRWMQEIPLDLVAEAADPNVTRFFQNCAEKGIKTAVVSDYDPILKLRALKLEGLLTTVVCPREEEVNRLKPDPTGLLTALARLRVRPHEAVYLGDRVDVDVEAARRAAIRPVLVSGRAGPSGVIRVQSFRDLSQTLFGD